MLLVSLCHISYGTISIIYYNDPNNTENQIFWNFRFASDAKKSLLLPVKIISAEIPEQGNREWLEESWHC